MKWIKCTDRLPEVKLRREGPGFRVVTSNRVLAYGAELSISILTLHDYIYKVEWLTDDHYIYENLIDVTHWMPLPEKPI